MFLMNSIESISLLASLLDRYHSKVGVTPSRRLCKALLRDLQLMLRHIEDPMTAKAP